MKVAACRFFIRSTCVTIFLLCGLSILVFSQQNYRGKVTDRDGNPLAGATVLNKQSNARALADSSGSFSITATPGSVLLISYIGYRNYEITTGAETIINIPLTET